MNELEKKRRKLQKKLQEAVLRDDLVKQTHILKELNELNKKKIVEISEPFYHAIKKHPEENRIKAMAKLFECIVVADIDATMAYETISYFRKEFGISDMPILAKLRQIAAQYDDIIKTIDEVGSEVFSFAYMDIVDEAKTKCEAVVSNTVSNIIQKVINAENAQI